MKIRRYTYIIIDGDNYRATYNQETANKAQADGKTAIAFMRLSRIMIIKKGKD